MRVDLGKGRWAEIVDVDDMAHGIKMKVQALLPEQDSMEHQYVTEMRMRELLLAHVVTEWSLDLPVPKGNATALDDVPGPAYDKLLEATEPHWESLDFRRIGSNSSSSETSSEGTESPDRNPDDEQ